jgi:hypothetical protein
LLYGFYNAIKLLAGLDEVRYPNKPCLTATYALNMLDIPITLETQINQLANDVGLSVDAFLDRLITDYNEEKNDIIEADAIYKRI